MAEVLDCRRSLPTMPNPPSNRSEWTLAVDRVQWGEPLLAVSEAEPVQLLAFRTQCRPSTVPGDLPALRRFGVARPPATTLTGGRPPPISRLRRSRIILLACLGPIAEDLHITHWTRKDPARQAVEDGIAPATSGRTVQAVAGPSGFHGGHRLLRGMHLTRDTDPRDRQGKGLPGGMLELLEGSVLPYPRKTSS